MFLILRILGGLSGLVTAGLVMAGLMTVQQFVVADLIIGALLIAAAVIPNRVWAWRGLLIGNAYALGVFTVALARQLGMDEGAVNPPLVLVMLTCGLGLIGLLTRPISAGRL